jgi:hypothetical protein
MPVLNPAPKKTTVAAGMEIHDWEHNVEVPPDDGSAVEFKWHFPRGTLAKRMSALELFGFLLRHMDGVAGLLSDHPRIHAEFLLLRERFLTWPKDRLDDVHGWCQSHVRRESDDIVYLSLGGRYTGPTPTWVVMGDAKNNV